MDLSLSVRKTAYFDAINIKSDLSEVQRANVVTSVVCVPILVTLRQSFLEVHILTTTYQKAFKLGPKYIMYLVELSFIP